MYPLVLECKPFFFSLGAALALPKVGALPQHSSCCSHCVVLSQAATCGVSRLQSLRFICDNHMKQMQGELASASLHPYKESPCLAVLHPTSHYHLHLHLPSPLPSPLPSFCGHVHACRRASCFMMPQSWVRCCQACSTLSEHHSIHLNRPKTYPAGVAHSRLTLHSTCCSPHH